MLLLDVRVGTSVYYYVGLAQTTSVVILYIRQFCSLDRSLA